MGDIYFTIIAKTKIILTLLPRNITKYFYCHWILFSAFLLFFRSVIIFYSLLPYKCFQSFLFKDKCSVKEENDMFHIHSQNSLDADTFYLVNCLLKNIVSQIFASLVFRLFLFKTVRVTTLISQVTLPQSTGSQCALPRCETALQWLTNSLIVPDKVIMVNI